MKARVPGAPESPNVALTATLHGWDHQYAQDEACTPKFLWTQSSLSSPKHSELTCRLLCLSQEFLSKLLSLCGMLSSPKVQPLGLSFNLTSLEMSSLTTF
jgi:hypothetical protein